jgi:ABC-type glycerol-3-phosphate transport system substrate-binding protein
MAASHMRAPDRTSPEARALRLSRRSALLHVGAASIAGTALISACRMPGRSAGEAQKMPQQPVTLEFLHRWEGPREPLIAQVLLQFQQQHPSITVNSQLVFGTGPEYFDGMPYDKIFTLIVAGTPPDVIMMGSDVAALWARRGNALLPLDEYLRRDRIEPEQMFYPALAQMARSQGKYHGLPQLTGTDRAYLFMHLPKVEAAGLDPKRPPASWEDLVDWSRQLTMREGDSFSQMGFDFSATEFIDWLARNGGRVLSEDARRPAFDSPAGQQTLQWLLETTNRLYGGKAKVDQFKAAHRGAGDVRYTGRLALWTGQVAEFFWAAEEGPKADPAFRFAAALVPHNVRNPQARPASLAEKIWMYSIAQGTRHPEAAWTLEKYLTLGEGNRMFVKAQGRPSPVVRYNDDPDYPRMNPFWDVVKQALMIMVPMPQTPAWAQIRPLLSRMLADVLDGKVGVNEALAKTATEAQALLDRAQEA